MEAKPSGKSKRGHGWWRNAAIVVTAGGAALALSIQASGASSGKPESWRGTAHGATYLRSKPSAPTTATTTPTTVAPAPATPPAAPTTTAATPPATTGTSYSTGSGTTSTTTPTTTPPAPPAPTAGTATVLEGGYVGPANPSGLSSFGTATGTHPTIASDYLPASSGWAGMDGANGGNTWLTGPWSSAGDTLSLGVPIIPTNANNVPVGTLAAGATGAYNQYFSTLASSLVSAGDSTAYLRLGWEFDGNWYAWDAGTAAAEANYAAYFRQIVTTMRAVPGAAFKFVWNPDADAFTTSGYSVAAAYPGSAYVDLIGLDVYDQSWATPLTPANAWSSTTLPDLTAAQQFAASVNEPLAVCEWGVTIRTDNHGLGDDPLYVNNMISWMRTPANHVVYESYFDYNTIPSGGDTNAALTSGSFPNSLAAFNADLG